MGTLTDDLVYDIRKKTSFLFKQMFKIMLKKFLYSIEENKISKNYDYLEKKYPQLIRKEEVYSEHITRFKELTKEYKLRSICITKSIDGDSYDINFSIRDKIKFDNIMKKIYQEFNLDKNFDYFEKKSPHLIRNSTIDKEHLSRFKELAEEYHLEKIKIVENLDKGIYDVYFSVKDMMKLSEVMKIIDKEYNLENNFEYIEKHTPHLIKNGEIKRNFIERFKELANENGVIGYKIIPSQKTENDSLLYISKDSYKIVEIFKQITEEHLKNNVKRSFVISYDKIEEFKSIADKFDLKYEIKNNNSNYQIIYYEKDRQKIFNILNDENYNFMKYEHKVPLNKIKIDIAKENNNATTINPVKEKVKSNINIDFNMKGR